jgi:hypothetical protein
MAGAVAGPAQQLFLDLDLSKAFLAWSLNEKHNTPAWVGAQKGALGWWMEKLRGVDLRHATPRRHFDPALERDARPSPQDRGHQGVLRVAGRGAARDRGTSGSDLPHPQGPPGALKVML